MQFSSRGCAAPARPRTFVPVVEALEGRDTPSTTVLTVSPNPATAGQTVTVTATVTRTGSDEVQPGAGQFDRGHVTFFDRSAQWGQVDVTPTAGSTTQGTAKFSFAALEVGTHSLSARYSGDINLFSGTTLPSTAPSTSNALAGVVTPVFPTSALTNLPSSVPFMRVRQGRRRGNVLQKQLKLRFDGPAAVAGPLFVVVRGLPGRVRLKNAAGQGRSPFLRLDVAQVSPGQELDVTLVLANLRKGANPTLEVFAGSLPL